MNDLDVFGSSEVEGGVSVISVSVSWMNDLDLFGSSAVEGGVSVGRVGANGVVLAGVNDRVGISSDVALFSMWPVFCELGVNDKVGISRLQAVTRVTTVRLTLQPPPSVHDDAVSVVYVQEL